MGWRQELRTLMSDGKARTEKEIFRVLGVRHGSNKRKVREYLMEHYSPIPGESKWRKKRFEGRRAGTFTSHSHPD